MPMLPDAPSSVERASVGPIRKGFLPSSVMGLNGILTHPVRSAGPSLA